MDHSLGTITVGEIGLQNLFDILSMEMVMRLKVDSILQNIISMIGDYDKDFNITLDDLSQFVINWENATITRN